MPDLIVNVNVLQECKTRPSAIFHDCGVVFTCKFEGHCAASSERMDSYKVWVDVVSGEAECRNGDGVWVGDGTVLYSGTIRYQHFASSISIRERTIHYH